MVDSVVFRIARGALGDPLTIARRFYHAYCRLEDADGQRGGLGRNDHLLPSIARCLVRVRSSLGDARDVFDAESMR